MAAVRRRDSSLSSRQPEGEDWEEWEDDDVVTLIDVGAPTTTECTRISSKHGEIITITASNSPTHSRSSSPFDDDSTSIDTANEPSPIVHKEQLEVTSPTTNPPPFHPRNTRNLSSRASRRSMGRVSRPKSRRPPKPMGMKIITDGKKLRQMNHSQRQLRSPAARAPKFVDAAALRALEGSPNEDSVGNWNWLRRNMIRSPDRANPQPDARSPDQQLSPEDRPIVIGISLPSDEAASVNMDPQTAVLETHTPIGGYEQPRTQNAPFAGKPAAPAVEVTQLKSVWSPDTPDTACSFNSMIRASSVYSQATMGGLGLSLSNDNVPPVPALPAGFKKAPHQRIVSLELGKSATEEDDSGTPCTLFEEDGTPIAMRGKLSAITPDSADSRAYGWWDHHVVTPFLDKRMSLASRKYRLDSALEAKSTTSEFGRGFLTSPHPKMSHLSPELPKSPNIPAVLPAAQFQKTQPVRNLGGDSTELLITFTTDEPEVDGKAREQQVKKHEFLSPQPVLPVAQAPIIRVPTPRQTPQLKPSAVLGETVISMDRQRQIVADRSNNSTPTLRLPTPRQTPPPQVKLSRDEVSYESLTYVSHIMEDQQKPRASEDKHVPLPYLPPYSPPKNAEPTAIHVHVVLPPDHGARAQLVPHTRTASPGLASTMSSQVTSRKLEVTLNGSSRPTTPSSLAIVQGQHEESSKKSISALARSQNEPDLAPAQPRVIVPVKKAEEKHEAERQVPPMVLAASTTKTATTTRELQVPQQQSRFSLSPTASKTSRNSEADVRSIERFILPSRLFGRRDQANNSIYSAKPVECHHDEFQQEAKGLPANPARAHLVVNNHESVTQYWSDGAPNVYGLEHNAPLPVRPAGSYLPEEHAHPADGPAHRVERERRRHEKEEKLARRAGSFWRGRGCIPHKGCFGRPGPEGRKKRRVWMCIIATIISLIILAVVLAVVLARHHAPHEAPSIWVNLTNFPPMPTGVLTVVGPENSVAKTGCTEPSTLWSCSLPKDAQSSVAPYQPNQPTVIFQIQWDNSSDNLWNVPNGDAPVPISARGLATSTREQGLEARTALDGFQPNPSPPAYEEMWFLGETTDGIVSSQKAGEPTPFFISLLQNVNATITSPSLSKRADSNSTGTNWTSILPPPDLEADGTPKPAVMLPTPVQQPVRLYDRGLPTEHYGFYTYFKRTIFLKSVTALNSTNEGNVPLDKDGGCSESEANFMVTWAEARMLVQVWTRKLDSNNNNNNTALLSSGGAAGINNSPQLIRPGTMPYPVTMTLDTHGGDPNHKVAWEWPMDERQQIDTSNAALLANNMAVGGTWLNRRGTGEAKFGGFDGGSGGCQCQWVNWA